MKLLSTLCLLGPIVLQSASALETAKRPNVVFVMTDDQDLLLQSMDVMHNVKSLIADQGVTYDSHYCTVALCCPSRVSLLTGKTAHNTNVTGLSLPYGGYPKFVEEGLNEDYLPIWLQKGGINTYYVGKLMNSHSITNYNKPFAKGWTNSNFLLQPGTYDYLNNTWSHNQKAPKSYPGINALDLIRNHSLAMLHEAASSGAPFFLAVAPAIPHLGLNSSGHGTHWPVPLQKWENAFNDVQVPRTPNFNPQEPSGAGWMLNLPFQDNKTVAEGDSYHRARLRVIAGVDDMVGDLIGSLEKKGILNNTYFVFTTDNGFHIGQHRLGPGKTCGIETDIHIPMVMRGPGMPAGKTTNIVTTHTDLVQTFMSMLNVKPSKKLAASFDGRPIPLNEVSINKTEALRPSEHVNVEHWGDAETGSAVSHLWPSDIAGHKNNTYKALRLVGQGFNLYYSVWCTNELQLYDMNRDPYQMNNLLANHNTRGTINGHPLTQVANRLDALLIVLKSCKGSTCTDPWRSLFPQGNVKTLSDALSSKYNSFFAKQPKVHFRACKQGYLIEFEGPQSVIPFSG